MQLKNLLIGGSVGIFLFSLYINAGAVFAASKSVSIIDNSFSPLNLSIMEGDTVVWTNNDSIAHRIEVLNASDSSFIAGNDLLPKVSTSTAGRTFSRKFNEEGNYIYRLDQQSTISGYLYVAELIVTPSPTVTAIPTVSSTPSATPAITPSATPMPTVSSTPSATPMPTVTVSPVPSPTPSIKPTSLPTSFPTVTPTPVPSLPTYAYDDIIPNFSVFRRTFCTSSFDNNFSYMRTDKVSSASLKRGIWLVDEFNSTTPTVKARLISIRTVNLLFGNNPFFGLDRTVGANYQAEYSGSSLNDMLRKVSVEWCSI